jgi:hypothetical protein
LISTQITPPKLDQKPTFLSFHHDFFDLRVFPKKQPREANEEKILSTTCRFENGARFKRLKGK